MLNCTICWSSYRGYVWMFQAILLDWMYYVQNSIHGDRLPLSCYVIMNCCRRDEVHQSMLGFSTKRVWKNVFRNVLSNWEKKLGNVYKRLRHQPYTSCIILFNTVLSDFILFRWPVHLNGTNRHIKNVPWRLRQLSIFWHYCEVIWVEFADVNMSRTAFVKGSHTHTEGRSSMSVE